MKYITKEIGEMRNSYTVIEGTAYIVCSDGQNTGLDIVTLHEGDEWCEGIGEEKKIILDSLEDAEKYILKTYGLRAR